MFDWCYTLTSELDELMFAFDYQDSTLELTNKVSSFIVYYSAERLEVDINVFLNISQLLNLMAILILVAKAKLC